LGVHDVIHGKRSACDTATRAACDTDTQGELARRLRPYGTCVKGKGVAYRWLQQGGDESLGPS